MAFEWTGDVGVILYEFPSDKRPDTSADSISLGFITPSFDAVLLRIDSYPDNNKGKDFMQVEIVSIKINLEASNANI